MAIGPERAGGVTRNQAVISQTRPLAVRAGFRISGLISAHSDCRFSSILLLVRRAVHREKCSLTRIHGFGVVLGRAADTPDHHVSATVGARLSARHRTPSLRRLMFARCYFAAAISIIGDADADWGAFTAHVGVTKLSLQACGVQAQCITERPSTRWNTAPIHSPSSPDPKE